MRARSPGGTVGAKIGQSVQELAADSGTAEEAQRAGAASFGIARLLRVVGQVLESEDVAHRCFRDDRGIVQRRAAGKFVVSTV